MKRIVIYCCLSLLLLACSKQVVKPTPEAEAPIVVPAPPAAESAPIQLPDMAVPAEMPVNAVEAPASPAPAYRFLKPAKWQDLSGLAQDDLSAAWPAWLRSCQALANKPQWKTVCMAASTIKQPGNANLLAYFKTYFDVYTAQNEDGTEQGLITGYYEPVLKGSHKKSAQYPYPLYRRPDDLIKVELADVYPELAYKRVRGKLAGNQLLPYLSRAEIDQEPSPLAGDEICWIDDIIDVFFLHIQGSGLVQLDNGEQMQVGYADQNGRAYQSIGRLLIERGELRADQASMQGIKSWARTHLGQLRALLNSNPSYVFFRALPPGLPGPLGALGVPVTAARSLAIDRQFIPLGAPVFLATTAPNSNQPLRQLMMAQDTGGAIKGGVRADFYWGAGNQAGAKAGAMKQTGSMWVLLPKGFELIPSAN